MTGAHAKRPPPVQLTDSEMRAILIAVGNTLTNDPDDEEAILGDKKTIAAAYRAQAKIRRVYYRR